MPIESNKNIKKQKDNKNVVVAKANYVASNYMNQNLPTAYPTQHQFGVDILSERSTGVKVGWSPTGTAFANGSSQYGVNDLKIFGQVLERVNNLRDGKEFGSIVAFDLETVGTGLKDTYTKASANARETAAFSVIEAAANEISWNNGERVTKNVGNYVFGITKKQAKDILNIINDFKEGKALNGSERSTIDTMAKIGTAASGIDGNLSVFGKGLNARVDYKAPSSFDKNDIELMEKGVKSLINLGEKGFLYKDISGPSKDTVGSRQMKSFLETISNAQTAYGQNIGNFDLPVLEREANIMGLNFNPKNVFMDTFKIMDDLKEDMSKAFIDKDGNFLANDGFRKLETYSKIKEFVEKAKLKGANSHTATYDIGINAGFIDVQLPGLGDKTITDYLLDSVKEKQGQLKNSSRYFRAIAPMGFKDLNGEISTLSNQVNSLDHISEAFNVITENGIKEKREYVNPYSTSAIKTNNIYEFLGVREVSRQDLMQMFHLPNNSEEHGNLKAIDDILQKQGIDANQNFYIAELSNKTAYNGEKSYIVRKDFDGLKNELDSILRPLDGITNEDIHRERSTVRGDSLRRTIDDYTNFHGDPSKTGYKALKRDIGTFKSAKETFNNFNIDFTRSNMEMLVREGFVIDKYNNKIFGHELSPNGKSIFGGMGILEKSTSYLNPTGGEVEDIIKFHNHKIKVLLDGFNFFESHYDYYSEILSQVDKSIISSNENNELDIKKTMIIKAIDDTVGDMVDEDPNFDFSKNRRFDASIKSTHMLNVDFGGNLGEHLINTSTVESTSKAIRNLARKEVNKTKNTKSNNAREAESYKKIALKLYRDGLLSKEDLERIQKINGKNELNIAIAKSVKNSVDGKTAGLDDSDRADFINKSKKYKKELEKEQAKPSVIRDDNKIKSLEEKIKGLDFIRYNTGGDSKEFNTKRKKFTITDRTTNKKLTIMEFLREKGFSSKDPFEKLVNKFNRGNDNILVDSEVTKGTLKTSKTISFNGNINDKDVIDIRKFFSKYAGYSGDEANNAIKSIFGNGGLLSKQQNRDNIGIHFVYDKNKRVAKMILAPSSLERAVDDSIFENTFKLKPNMAVIDIPTVKSLDGDQKNMNFDKRFSSDYKTVGIGSNQRIVSHGIDFYFNKTIASSDGKSYGSAINWTNTSSVTEVIGALKFGADNYDIATLLKNGQAGIIEAMLNKTIKKKLETLVPISGQTYASTIDGVYNKITVLNKTDIANFNKFNTGSFINLIPFLWRESVSSDDKHLKFRKTMEDLFDKQRKSNKKFDLTTDEFFDNYLKRLIEPKNKYSSGLSLDKVKRYQMNGKTYDMSFLVEHFITNQTAGLKYFDMFKESDFIKGANQNQSAGYGFLSITRDGEYKEKSGDLISHLNKLSKSFSQIITEKNVSASDGSIMPVLASIAFGDIQDHSRPTSSQIGNVIYTNLAKFNSEEIKAMKESGITLGAAIEARKVTTENGITKFIGQNLIEDKKHGLFESFTINTKMIQDSEISRVVREFGASENNKHIDDVLFDILYGGREKTEARTKRVLELKEEVLADFLHMSTNQQRSEASPMLSMLLHKDTFKNIRTDKYDTNFLKVGDTVSTGMLIGIDSSGKEVRYKGRDGKVINIDEYGVTALKVTDNASLKQKTLSGAEKSVNNIRLYGSLEETKFAQAIWDSVFGKDIQQLSNFELGKHSSASFALDKITDIANLAIREDSKEAIDYLQNKLAGTYVQGSIDKAGLYKAYEGTDLETTSFVLASNTDATNEQNIVGAYKDVHDSIINDAMISFGKVEKGEALSPLDEFLAKFYKEKIDNEAMEGVYRNTIVPVKSEKSFSVGSDEFATTDEIIASKTGKFSFRDMFFFGRHKGYSDDSRKLYYDITADGKVTNHMGSVITNNIIKNMTLSKGFAEEAKDIQAIINSAILMNEDIDYSKMDAKDFDNLEMRKGLANDVFHTTLDEIVLPGQSASPDMIRDTIFGKADGKSIVRIDLTDSNMSINNPLLDAVEGEDGLLYGVSNKKTKFLYVANTRNEFVQSQDGDEMFTPSQYQKKLSGFLNNLQQASGREENALKALSFAQNDLNTIYEESIKMMNDKEGLLLGKLFNRRVAFSGGSIYGQIISPDGAKSVADFDKIQKDKPLYFQNLDVDLAPYREGGGKGYLDIAYTSEKHLKELGGKNIIDDVGFQLVNENFDNNTRFKNLLEAEGILGSNGRLVDKPSSKIYSKIGRMFLETEGIQGANIRFPSFNANSQVAVNIRLKPKGLTGDMHTLDDSTIIHQHTAKKLNADLDGDTGMNVLWGERVNGRFRFHERGSEVREAHERLIVGQAIDNADFWINEGILEAAATDILSKGQSIDAETYVKKMMIATENTGFTAGGKLTQKAVKAKFDKISIGPISTVNFYANQLAFHGFIQNPDGAMFDQFKELVDYTNYTEQAIISAKKGDATTIDHTDKAQRYKKALTSFQTAYKDHKGIEDTLSILSDMEVINLDLITQKAEEFDSNKSLEEVLSLQREDRNRFINSLSGEEFDLTRKLLKGIGSLQELYSMDSIVELNEDYLFKNTGINSHNMIDALHNIEQGNYSQELFGGQLKALALGFETRNLDEARKLSTETQKLTTSRNNAFVDTDGAVHMVDSDLNFLSRNSDGTKTYSYKTKNAETGDISNRIINVDNTTKTDDLVTRSLRDSGMMAIDINPSNPDTLNLDELLNLDVATRQDATIGQLHLDSFRESNVIDNKEYIIANNEYHKQLIESARNYKDNSPQIRQNLNDKINSVYQNAVTATNDDGRNIVSNSKINRAFDGAYTRDSVIDISNNSLGYSTDTSMIRANEGALNYGKGYDHKSSIKLRDNISSKAFLPNMPELFNFIDEKVAETNANFVESNVYDKPLSEVQLANVRDSVVESINRKNSTLKAQIRDTVVASYTKSAENTIGAMGWGGSIGNYVDHMTTTAGSIGVMDELGKAMIYRGSFAGNKASDLSMSQLQVSIKEMSDFLINGTNISEIERELITLNHDALDAYSRSIEKSATLYKENGDEALLNRIDKAFNQTDVKLQDLSESVDTSGINIGDELKKSHQMMIQKANFERKAFERTLDGRMSKAGSGKKAALATLGIAVAGSMMAGVLGIAGRLDPNSKDTLEPIDRADGGVVVRRNAGNRTGFGRGNVPMQKRTNTVRAKGSHYSSGNNDNIIKAMSVNYGTDNVKVNINNEGIDDNNNKWLEREVAGYIYM